MKTHKLLIWLSIYSLLMFTATPQRVRAEDTPTSSSQNIYDASANGAQQISDALIIARKEHKRVLLEFGANWCIWCHTMHDLFETNKPIANELNNGYVVVLIDVDKGRNQEIDARYGKPSEHGIPAIVLLDADGKQLTTQDTEKFEEEDHYNPERVLAFLKKWTQKR